MKSSLKRSRETWNYRYLLRSAQNKQLKVHSCSLHLFSQWLEDSVKSVLVFTLTPNILCPVGLGKCVSIKIPFQRSFINHLTAAIEVWPLALCPSCPANASPFRQLHTTWGCLPHGCPWVIDLNCYWLLRSVSWKIIGKNMLVW